MQVDMEYNRWGTEKKISVPWYLVCYYIWNCKLEIANWKVQIGKCKLKSANWKVQIEKCKLESANCKLKIENWKLKIANCKLQIANCKLKIGKCKLESANWKFYFSNFHFSIILRVLWKREYCISSGGTHATRQWAPRVNGRLASMGTIRGN